MLYILQWKVFHILLLILYTFFEPFESLFSVTFHEVPLYSWSSDVRFIGIGKRVIVTVVSMAMYNFYAIPVKQITFCLTPISIKLVLKLSKTITCNATILNKSNRQLRPLVYDMVFLLDCNQTKTSIPT